jgi:hypothetical protein
MENDESRRSQMLKEIAGALNRHDLDAIMSFFAEDAILDMPRGPSPQWQDVEEGAGPLGVQLQRQRLEVRNPDDLERAFQAAVSGRADAVLRLADPVGRSSNRGAVLITARPSCAAMLHEWPW